MNAPIGHFRVNIPPWGGPEVLRGLMALAGWPRGAGDRARLHEELARAVPGRSPVLVSSARFALALAVRALGLVGARIAVPGYLCPAVLTGLRAAPAEPVPVDCRPWSTRFDLEALSRTVAEGGAVAVLAVNTYGADQDFPALERLGVPVIEDAAYQAGRTEPGDARPCGSRGVAGVWSFHFKALTAPGGGVLWLPPEQLETLPPPPDGPPGLGEVARFLNYSLRGVARHRIPRVLPGARPPGSERKSAPGPALAAIRERSMSGLQAAVALAQWESRAAIAAVQRRNSQILAEAVTRCPSFTQLDGKDDAVMVHLFPILVRAAPGRAAATVFEARRQLHARGIQTEVPYPILLGTEAELPRAHALARHLLLVPCNASLREDQARYIAGCLVEVSRRIEASIPPIPESVS